ncbi:hypothetical protein [Patulibacter defluvii]|uniref:hypothetical protein n=1 Tax=Patulibacter defluvii TaxID=3095358 RepID=UPI002A752FFB|nr:hypothetical protein [Patulibacter sp. DM4]
MEAVPSGVSAALPSSAAADSHTPTVPSGRPLHLHRIALRRIATSNALRWVVLAAAVGGVAAVVAVRWPHVAVALGRVPPAGFAALTAVHLLTLALRSEAWRGALAAIGGVVLPRRVVHGANAAAFLSGSLAAHLALPVRAVVLRRLAPEQAPRPLQIVATDAPVAVVEAVLCALLLLASVVAGGGSWWRATVAVAAAIGLVALVRLLFVRLGHRPAARGLAILADRGRRGRFVLLLGAVQLLMALRAVAALALCGVPVGVADVGPLHAALGVLGLLPIGVAASPTGAAAVGGGSDGAVLAGGLVIAATAVAAVLVYGALLGAIGLRARLRAA